MTYPNQNVSGFAGSGTQLSIKDSVAPKITLDYYCQSPLSRMANWNGDADGTLVCGGKVHYETSLGIAENDVCEGDNADVSHLYQRFSADYLELCGEDIFTFKRNHRDAIRLCDRLNELDNVLFADLEERMNQMTVPFALMKLIASASAEGRGLGAIGIPSTGGVAAGLGDLNNPIKIDVSSSRSGGNVLQSGAIDMGTLKGRMITNMFAKGVTCSTNELMISGSGQLHQGFAADKLCQDSCSLIQTGMQYNITQWMPSATNAAGQRIDYIVMHDPREFWFKLYTLYMHWVTQLHHADLGGAMLWGAKVHRPKSVSVAAVQYV